MATTFEIEKGLEAPALKTNQKYPLRQMEIGDSFAAPRELRGTLSNVATFQGRKLGRRYSVRNDGDGIRVWRVA